MKHAISTSLSLLIGLGTSGGARSPFSTCSAAFVGTKRLVDHDTPTGRCQLANKTKRPPPTVQTVNVSPTGIKSGNKLAFNVAVQDGATGTVPLFSTKTHRQLPVERVLTSCKKGARIGLLTLDQHIALPHTEIQVR